MNDKLTTYPVTPVIGIWLWLFGRSLFRHLLLALFYATLLLAACGDLDLPVWLVPPLVMVGIGATGATVMLHRHYPRRKMLMVHLAGVALGLGALWISPPAIFVAYALTLLLFAYPCRDCIVLTLPTQE